MNEQQTQPKTEALDVELLDSKAVKALRKDRGDGYIKDLLTLSDEELKNKLSSLVMAKEEVKRETDKNPSLVEASGVVSDFKAAVTAKVKPINKEIKVIVLALSTRKEARRK